MGRGRVWDVCVCVCVCVCVVLFLTPFPTDTADVGRNPAAPSGGKCQQHPCWCVPFLHVFPFHFVHEGGGGRRLVTQCKAERKGGNSVPCLRFVAGSHRFPSPASRACTCIYRRRSLSG